MCNDDSALVCVQAILALANGSWATISATDGAVVKGGLIPVIVHRLGLLLQLTDVATVHATCRAAAAIAKIIKHTGGADFLLWADLTLLDAAQHPLVSLVPQVKTLLNSHNSFVRTQALRVIIWVRERIQSCNVQ